MQRQRTPLAATCAPVQLADAPEQIDDMVQFVKDCGAEEVFCEAVNARGNSLTLTEQVLRDNSFLAEAEAVSAIRKRKAWSCYATSLTKNIQRAVRKYMTTKALRILFYPSGLTEQDRHVVQQDDAGVVWL
jgi:hypothetical protein